MDVKRTSCASLIFLTFLQVPVIWTEPLRMNFLSSPFFPLLALRYCISRVMLFIFKCVQKITSLLIRFCFITILYMSFAIVLATWKTRYISWIYSRRFCQPIQNLQSFKQNPSKNRTKICKQFTDFSKSEKSLHWGDFLIEGAWRVSKISRQSWRVLIRL